jgi:predicted RecB family nuclease
VPHRLSKSRFTAGLQCLKQLWWRVHEPDARELVPDFLLQSVFERGHRVGAVARGYVPGGSLVALPHHAAEERVALTAEFLAQGAPVVYEASFIADDTFVAVDILERQAKGFALVEVKSTTSVKDEHIPDAAIQAYVLRTAGLDVRKVELMHLNRECRFPDLSNLFARVDVTKRVEALAPLIPDQVAEQLAALDGPLPDVPIGDHCDAPYECPFKARCWPVAPEHHVGTLYRWGKRARELERQGFRTIEDLPAGLDLGEIPERQRRAVQAGRMIVEPGLADALRIFDKEPLGYLDFETVGLAIPVWKGCRPYDAVPVQFSFFVDRGSGEPEHHEHLASGPGDPRPALAERLVAAAAPSAAIVAYNAGFERQCMRALAEAVPALSEPLLALERKLVDLLPVVRNYVYHPAFHGSFSLKSVLPALVLGLTYADLEISDGDTASVYLERMLLGDGEKRRGGPGQLDLFDGSPSPLRSDLLAYCKRDTWAMVKLLERLRGLVRRS